MLHNRLPEEGPAAVRLALVTGAAGIIGPAITATLRAKGWRVIATDRDQESFDLFERAFGQPVDADEVLLADIATEKSCHVLVKEIEHRHGCGLSAVVNSAVLNTALPLGSIGEGDILRLFAVNFMAPLFLVQAALPSLIRNRGSVVNLSSVLVDEPRKGGLLYACSKAALEKATTAMTFELFGSGVRLNNLRVGRIFGYAFLRDTLKKLPRETAQRMVRELLNERFEEMEATQGAGAAGRPEDIAQIVAYLLSEKGRFISGQTIIADGGYTPFQPPINPSPTVRVRQISEWLEENGLSAENI